MPPSLHDIEKTLTALWMNRSLREEFLAGATTSFDPILVEQIDRNGVELYAGLLNYGHHDVLDSIYPLCAKLLGKSWFDAVERYLKEFPPTHFNLNRIGKNFPRFVREHMEQESKRYPFLYELADYEWLEMELLECRTQAPKSELESLETPEQFALFAPIVNPVLALKHYHYPLTSIAAKLEQPKSGAIKTRRKETNVIIYRDPHNHRCRFMSVGSTARAIIETAQRATTPYTELIALAVSSNPQSDPQATISEFLDLIERLQSAQLLLGNKRVS